MRPCGLNTTIPVAPWRRFSALTRDRGARPMTVPRSLYSAACSSMPPAYGAALPLAPCSMPATTSAKVPTSTSSHRPNA